MQVNFTIVEIKGFENVYLNMDMDGDGLISIEELAHVAQYLGCKLDRQTLENMLNHYSTGGKASGAGEFNYTSFCTMLLEMKSNKGSKLWGSLYEKIHGAISRLIEKEGGGGGEAIRLSQPWLYDVCGRPPKPFHERFCFCGCQAQEQKPSNKKKNVTPKKVLAS